MIIRRLKYAPINLQLKSPFKTSQQTINERRGFIIRIEDDKNRNFYGEISPLPGFSKENYTHVENQLRTFSETVKNEFIADSLDAVLSFTRKFQLYPSVRFGLEQALINSSLENSTGLFKNTDTSSIQVNAVTGIETPEKTHKIIKQYVEDGFETIKLKIGRRSFDEDLFILKEIRNGFGSNIKLRFDVNGAWTYEEAKSKLKTLYDFEFEYIEEPCAGITDQIKLFNAGYNKIAIDESLSSIHELKNLITSESLSYFVLKPMLLGSIIEMIDLIGQIKGKNLHFIFSSAFESPVAKSMLVLLAALSGGQYAHGLNTSDFFMNNICIDSYPVKNGMIDFNIHKFPPHFEIDNLFK